MLTSLRSEGTVYGSGQIHLKLLSGVERVELTHDDQVNKMGPVFSPDALQVSQDFRQVALNKALKVIPQLPKLTVK